MNVSIRNAVCLLSCMLLFSGCYTEHKVDTTHVIEVKPMHITIDINVKVDRALDDFFGDIDQTGDDTGQPADTQN